MKNYASNNIKNVALIGHSGSGRSHKTPQRFLSEPRDKLWRQVGYRAGSQKTHCFWR